MKISAKYENELKKLFELSKKTYVVNFQLKNEELISNFSNISFSSCLHSTLLL